MDCIILDQGNTSTKWGVFAGGKLMHSGRVLDEHLSAQLIELKDKYNLPFLFSSVRSEKEQVDFLTRFEFCSSIPNELFPAYNYTSGEAGKDRLANVAGASALFKGEACLVIDFGTCITYSIANQNELISGVISLGAQSRLRGMHEFTGKLPLLNFVEANGVFQNSTTGAMMSSVNFGIVSELKGYIEQALEESPEINVVFTGSDAMHFAKQLNYRIFVELNLTLIGLYAITCANES
jgi:type III pantothenate kinase